MIPHPATDPELNLPSVTAIIPVQDPTQPLPFSTWFAPDRPLEVDVGCGNGRFLLARANAHPELQFLGIDRMLSRIRKIDRKVMRAGLTHVRLLRLEAFYALKFLLPPHCIRAFHIYFPDPWPKRRHHRRRLFSDEFLDVLWSRLEPGGMVQAATDHLDYFDWIQKRFAADVRFRPVPHVPRSAAEYTDFELIFRRQGLPIGECAFISLPATAVPGRISGAFNMTKQDLSPVSLP